MRSLLALALVLAASPARAEPATNALLGPDESDPIVWLEHAPVAANPVLGPHVAPVTIDFFGNLADGARTAAYSAWLEELAARHPTRLRIVYHLTNRVDRSSDFLELGREAFAQGRFFPFLDAYYGRRRRTPSRALFDEIASQSGLDLRRVHRALDDGRHGDAISAAHYRRLRLGVAKVPAIAVNGEPVEGDLRSLEDLETAYDRGYARALTLLDAGVPVAEIYPRQVAEVAAKVGARAVTPGSVDGLEPGEVAAPAGAAIDLGVLAGAGHARGADEPQVVFHVFCNLESRHCADTARALDAAESSYPGALRVVFHHLFDADSETAAPLLAEAVECAADDDRLWPFLDELAGRRQRRGLEVDDLVTLATSLGLDAELFEGCLESGRKAAPVEAAIAAARLAGIDHTPTIVVGQRAYVGTLDFQDLRTLVERALSPGLLGRLSALPSPGAAAQGVPR